MRKLNYVIVVMMLSMPLFGCGRAQDKIVINYCKALEAGKLDEAASYLSKDARQVLERAGGKSLLAAAGGAFKQHKGISAIKITKREISGERATVSFVYKFNDGSSIGDYFPLVKEDGNWKIAK
jgi:hypothetical protein